MSPFATDRIAIVMMTALGDAVHVLPVVTALKRQRPDRHITWVLQPGPAKLVRGHPDIDACAFAVHAACALLLRHGSPAPAIVEMTSYHAGPDGRMTATFLEWPGLEVVTLRPEAAERALKQSMIACFTTQQQVLAAFPVELERFRPAPAYDFTRPPHEGRLFYENFDWGVDGERWRALAREALVRLGLA